MNRNSSFPGTRRKLIPSPTAKLFLFWISTLSHASKIIIEEKKDIQLGRLPRMSCSVKKVPIPQQSVSPRILDLQLVGPGRQNQPLPQKAASS